MADVNLPDSTATVDGTSNNVSESDQSLITLNVPPPENNADETALSLLIAGQGVTDVAAASRTTEEDSQDPLPVFVQTTQDSADGNADTKSTGDPGSTAQNTTTKARGPVSNILNNYVSYTYNISLHMLTPEQYNKLLNGNYTPEEVLIASAGRRGQAGPNNKFKRNKYWEEDFYFEKLNLSSVIGYNAKSKGSNVVKLEFDIIEPYGISLLDRLILTAQQFDIPNYLLAPYLLQIEFFGYDDEKLNPLQEGIQRRLLPIKITTMDINFDQKGTVYSCTAVPFNHWAFEQDIITLPVAAKIQVDKTPYLLREFFGTDKEQVDKLSAVLGVNKETDIRNQEEARREYEQTISTAGGPISDADLEVIRQDINKKHQVKPPLPNATGLGSILNAYYRYLAETEKFETIPYIYEFVFQGDLNSTTIITKGLRDFASTNSAGAKQLEESTVAVSGVNETPANEGVQLTFQRGTSILKLIEQFITISEYMTSQLDTVKTPEDKRKVTPLQFYKVTPKIELGGYDKKRNDFSRKVTYVIQPSIAYNNRLPFGPQGAPTDDKVVKEYNYLYTGKNDEIIDLKINFQNAFIGTYTGGAVLKSQDLQRPEDTPSADTETPLTLSDPTKFPARLVARSANDGSKFDNTSELTVKSHDLFNNIFSRSQADMVNLSMTIRGDPGYIQEEDFVYFWDGSRPKDENDDRLFQSGSLVINDSQLLAKIQFRFPDDIDTQSGLYTSNRTVEKANGNLFSGIYIVVKVDSMFEHGSFTQKLDLVKVFNDPRALLKTAKDSELTRQQSQTEANEANQPLGLEEQISQQEIATSQYGVDDTDQAQADFTRQENKATEAEEALYNTRQAQQTETTTDVAAREQISEGQKISSDIEAAQEAELARNTLFGI